MKVTGSKNGSQTIQFMGGDNIYEIGVVGGDFVMWINNKLTHNLGTIESSIVTNTSGIASNLTSLALKAPLASPVFTGTITAALATYANNAAALAGGLTIGQLYQITGTAVVMVVVAGE